jgi:glycosyltransferase involved in cell wall biosynthesis
MGGERRFDVAYIGLRPIPHKSEGLNVLLCDTIKPLIDDGIQVTVHTTDRHRSKVASALEGNGVDLSRIDLRSYSIGSIGLRLIDFMLNRRHPRARESGRLMTLIRQCGRNMLRALVGLSLWLMDMTVATAPLKLVGLLVYGALGMLATAVALFIVMTLIGPALFLVLGVWVAMRVVRAVSRRFRPVKHALAATRRRLRQELGRMVPELYKREQLRFAARINAQSDIRTVFFCNAFDGAAVRTLRARTVVVFPDAVTSLYPIRFAGSHVRTSLDSMTESVRHADGLVCYSEFVRDKQLRRLFPDLVAGKPVQVIPQGYFPPRPPSASTRLAACEAMNKELHHVVNLFPDLLRRAPVVQFGQFDLVLYPTIDRAHKNTATLVRALNILIRKRYRNVKLLLTTPAPTPDVRQLIFDERLQYDVLFMPSVPLRTLDLMFEMASVMVHPSLAEGGDIFNFSRAVSVNVPALMANVPVVREMFERDGVAPEVFDPWLFNATDPERLAEKIEEALDHPDRYLQPQRETLARLATYDFRTMAHKYLQFCESV